MNIYLITQPSSNVGYDTYDSAIVAAETPYEAVRIHPGYDGEDRYWDDSIKSWRRGYGDNEPVQKSYEWIDDIEKITCQLVGKAEEGVDQGVILASFNAG